MPVAAAVYHRNSAHSPTFAVCASQVSPNSACVKKTAVRASCSRAARSFAVVYVNRSIPSVDSATAALSKRVSTHPGARLVRTAQLSLHTACTCKRSACVPRSRTARSFTAIHVDLSPVRKSSASAPIDHRVSASSTVPVAHVLQPSQHSSVDRKSAVRANRICAALSSAAVHVSFSFV